MCFLGEVVVLVVILFIVVILLSDGLIEVFRIFCGEVVDRISSLFKGWEGLEGIRNLKI